METGDNSWVKNMLGSLEIKKRVDTHDIYIIEPETFEWW